MKKKIRAIQYGVGPIGASIARLMREKQAIEIIGAIDTDPAKVGRDLGTKLEVTEGISIKDRVIENPSDGLADGTQVQVAGSQNRPVAAAQTKSPAKD